MTESMLLMHVLKNQRGKVALVTTLLGSILPWIRLALRGHVEFCDGECNPRDWLDYAAMLGEWLALCIPVFFIVWLGFRFYRDGKCGLSSILVWMLVLISVISNSVYLAYLEQKYFDQF